MGLDFGECFRAWRTSRSLTQEALSKELGVPQTTISGWESGGAIPRKAVREKLADFYGITVQELFAGPPVDAQSADAQ
jgi:transcriptional regulator with XRE-family HTH domain